MSQALYVKGTLVAPNIAETVLQEKATKTKKSEIYYDRNAKDFSELEPGDAIRVKHEGLVKGQEGRKADLKESWISVIRC